MKPDLITACITTFPSGQPMEKSRASLLMFACFLGSLAAAAASGANLLYLTTVFFFFLTIYYGVTASDWLPHQASPLTAGDPGRENVLSTAHHELPVGMEYNMAGAVTLCAAAAEKPFRDDTTQFTTITFRNRLERSFATGTGRRLVIGSGVINGTINIGFHPEQRADADMDTIGCNLRLADISGQTWECRLLMLPYLLTDPIEPGALLPPGGFCFFSEAPLSWKYAFRHSCLISGVRNMLDTRDIGELVINDCSYRIFFKHQKSLIDVAYLDSRASFIVRISGLINDVNLHGEYLGSQVLPPFCYAVPAEELLFFTAQHHYYSYYEEWYAMEDGIKKKDPLFFGLHQKAKPQPLVCVTS